MGRGDASLAMLRNRMPVIQAEQKGAIRRGGWVAGLVHKLEKDQSHKRRKAPRTSLEAMGTIISRLVSGSLYADHDEL